MVDVTFNGLVARKYVKFHFNDHEYRHVWSSVIWMISFGLFHLASSGLTERNCTDISYH